MKFFILFLLIASLESFATSSRILKCLGQEEARLHKNKDSGLYYKLNKKIIGPFLQMAKTLNIKKKYQEKVCNDVQIPPSLYLLKVLIKHKENAFISTASSYDKSQQINDEKTITEVTRLAIFTLVDLINNLQARASKPNCILNKVPELKSFYKKMQFTLEEVDVFQISKEISDIDSVIKKLSRPGLTRDC